jgi:F-type H+-transporting ATPase subunit alpha
LDLGQYYEMLAFAQFGSELDQRTQQQLDRGARIVELFKQPRLHPKSVEMQVFLLWAVQNGYLDDVAVAQTHGMGEELEKWADLNRRPLLDEIAQRQELEDDLVKKLAGTMEEWKLLVRENSAAATQVDG